MVARSLPYSPLFSAPVIFLPSEKEEEQQTKKDYTSYCSTDDST